MKKFRTFVYGLALITIFLYLFKFSQSTPKEIIISGNEITAENLIGLWQTTPATGTLGGARKFEFYSNGKLFVFYESNKAEIGWKIEAGNLILFRMSGILIYEVVQFSRNKVWIKLDDSTTVLIRK